MPDKPDAYFLSSEDREWFRRLVDQELKKVINARVKEVSKDTNKSSGVYLVKVPEDGVPARGSDGVLGSALCEVVRRNRGDDKLVTIQHTPEQKLQVKVWNPYLLPWPPGTLYIVAEKDKHGEYYCRMPDPVFGVFRAELLDEGTADYEVLHAETEIPTGIHLTVSDFYLNTTAKIPENTKAEIVQMGEKLVWRNAYCGPSDSLKSGGA